MTNEEQLEEFRSFLRAVGKPPGSALWSEEEIARFQKWLNEKPERRVWIGMGETSDADTTGG